MAADVTAKEIAQRCAAALRELGFKTTGGTAHYPINDAVCGWVGLNTVRRGGTVRVHPNIGVHCVPVMRCLASLRGKKYQVGSVATHSNPLGVILPDEMQIVIAQRSDIEPEIDRLMSYIDIHAREHLVQYADLAVLATALHREVHQFGGKPEMYALTLLLDGRTQDFRDFLPRQTLVLEQYGDPDLLAQWRDFGSRAEACMLSGKAHRAPGPSTAQ